jgi:hypothetical protein
MFRLFKSSKDKAKSNLKLEDLDHNPLKEGDLVQSLRYDLGKCRIIKTENGIEYESLQTGKKVNWSLMIDAATELQKVKKLDE